MKRKALHTLPFVLVAVYLFLAALRLKYPGVNYDEVFYGNAALGGFADNTFIKTRFLGVPLFLLEYIGALKAWLYYPVFRLFGVSILTIRMPMILFSAISLYLVYRTVKGMWGEGTALIALVLSVAEPNFVSMTRVDFGPVALSYFFRVMSMLLFFRFIRTKQKRYVFWLFFVLILGWFNKMDFAWFIIAFCISSLVFYWGVVYEQLFKRLSKRMRFIGIAALLVFTGTFGFIAAKYGFFRTIDFFYFSHLVRVIRSTFQLLGGILFYNTIYKPITSLWPYAFPVAVMAVILLNTLYEYLHNVKNRKEYFFILISVSLIYFQIIITSKAGAPWHLIYLYPFLQILLAKAISNIGRIEGKRGMALMAPVILSIVLYQAFINAKYIGAYGRPSKSVHWSSAIYDLISFTQKSRSRFVSVDWGTHNQLLVFDYRRGKYFDEWPRFLPDPVPPKDRIFLIYGYYMNSNTLFILHSKEATEFKQTRVNFFRIARDLKMEPKLVKTFREGGKTIYEIYRVEPSGG